MNRCSEMRTFQIRYKYITFFIKWSFFTPILNLNLCQQPLIMTSRQNVCGSLNYNSRCCEIVHYHFMITGLHSKICSRIDKNALEHKWEWKFVVLEHSVLVNGTVNIQPLSTDSDVYHVDICNEKFFYKCKSWWWKLNWNKLVTASTVIRTISLPQYMLGVDNIVISQSS